MIVLYTDFGISDPYVGQMHGVLQRLSPKQVVVDLLHAVPSFDIRRGAYLLPAVVGAFAEGTVFLCVVDPGVGGRRDGVVLKVDGKLYVGPDNGLFAPLMAQGKEIHAWRIRWRPPQLSNSFHGRDLFAPIAAAVALGDFSGLEPVESPQLESGRLATTWPLDLAEIIYVDKYGNALTGWRGEAVDTAWQVVLDGQSIPYARTFCAVAEEAPFWYIDSMGLVEIAVNKGSAAERFTIGVGTSIAFSC